MLELQCDFIFPWGIWNSNVLIVDSEAFLTVDIESHIFLIEFVVAPVPTFGTCYSTLLIFHLGGDKVRANKYYDY